MESLSIKDILLDINGLMYLPKIDEKYSDKFGYANYFRCKGLHTDRIFAFRFYANLAKKYKKTGNLLELGCSFGYLLKRLEINFNTYGIDISKDAIRQSKSICTKSKTFVGDIANLSIFQDSFFDIVIGLHVLEHSNMPDKAMSEVYRILKKKGIFIFATPNTSCLLKNMKGQEWHGYRDETHVSIMEPSEWVELTEKKGFKIKKAFSDGFWDSPYIPFVPAIIQKPLFGFLTAIEFIFCAPFIPVKLGETLIVVAEKL